MLKVARGINLTAVTLGVAVVCFCSSFVLTGLTEVAKGQVLPINLPVMSELNQEWRQRNDVVSQEQLDTAVSDIELKVVAPKSNHNIFLSQEVTLDTLVKADFLRTSRHPLVLLGVIYLVLLPSTWCLLLIFRPLWLWYLDTALLKLDLSISVSKLTFVISPRLLLFVKLFAYHTRVLDVWVTSHLKLVRSSFLNQQTVRDRQVYVPFPVEYNGEVVTELIGMDLRPTFYRQTSLLLIWGEVGTGRTNLALQIAKWAMSDIAGERLCEHHMLPVLIEQEFELNQPEPLFAEIGRKLQYLGGAKKPINDELLKHLLKQRRVLVVVDNFSEMSETTRKVIRLDSVNCYVNALVITSCFEENLGKVFKSTLKPLRIETNRLPSFMETYLIKCGKRNLFQDADLLTAGSRLSAIVAHRNIPALFIKLYIEQLIVAKESNLYGDLPNNIPNLVFSYLNELNQNVIGNRFSEITIHNDAKQIAWECMKYNFSLTPISYESALNKLALENNAIQYSRWQNQSKESTKIQFSTKYRIPSQEYRLQYLETSLRLIQTVGNPDEHIRFVFEPVAEYLAGLYLLETYSHDEEFWQTFIMLIDKIHKTPDAIEKFLRIIRGCIHSHNTNQYHYIIDILAKFAANPILIIVEKFLHHLDAKFSIASDSDMILSQFSGRLELYDSLPLLVTKQTTEKDVIRLIEYEKSTIGRNMPIGLIVYKEAPLTITRRKIAKILKQQCFKLIPIPLNLIEHNLGSKTECIRVFDDYVNRYLQHFDK